MEYPRILAMTSASVDASSKVKARKVQTEISLTASWNRPQFVSHMTAKPAMYGRTFFRRETFVSSLSPVGCLLKKASGIYM
jgi:hypothetical protein